MEFSNYPLPKKKSNHLQIFYNNVNGMEINELVQTIVQKKRKE